MKTVCVSNDPKSLADHQRGRVWRFESAYPLTPGRVYPVVAMMISETIFEFLVPDDWDGPCFVPAGMFELFTEAIPKGWKFSLESGIRASGRALWSEPGVALWGYPELVDDPDYIRALVEGEPDAVAVFQREVTAALSKEE